MTEKELKALRAHFHAMAGLENTLATLPATAGQVVDAGTFEMVASEVRQIEAAFRGILPQFRKQDFFSHDVGRGAYYRLETLKLYVARAVGRLRIEIETTDSTPVTQVRAFAYVADPALRALVARDYAEAQRAFVAKCWKSVIILSGSLIEALLLDLLQKNAAGALQSKVAPAQADLNRWVLSQLIDVAVDLNLVSVAIAKLSHPVREYRNLIHPGVELRTNIAFDSEEARIALEVLHIVDRDLS
jgi:hypothetical protein